MTSDLRRKLKLYLIGWSPGKSKDDFLKYRVQNRFHIKDQYLLMQTSGFNKIKNNMFKRQSNFNIYCINRQNYTKKYLLSIMEDCRKNTFKSILFFPSSDKIYFTKSEIEEINIILKFNKPSDSPIALDVVLLTNLLFKFRYDDGGISPHTDDGSRFYHFEDDTDWEYV